MDGIQAWVALPREREETDPAFSHHTARTLDRHLRLIAGEAFGEKSPVPVHSPLFYLHCELAAGGTANLPDHYPERAAYVASGTVEAEGRRFSAGHMVVFGPGPATLQASTPATLMLLGGEPVGERFIDWNFVSSSKERIEQARADWRAGRMKLPDLDNQEFIALPGE
jgi:redox-sensitive bicupin YhaK (pirin superfamily)